MIWYGLKIKKKLVNQFHGNCSSKTPSFRGIKSVFRDVKSCFNASWGFRGLKVRACEIGARGFATTLHGILISMKQHVLPRSDRQCSNVEACVWRAVSSALSQYLQEAFLAQMSLDVLIAGLTPFFTLGMLVALVWRCRSLDNTTK